MQRETVEVFKTNVNHPSEALVLTTILQQYFPGSKISFDLEDCDKVLRVQGNNISTEIVLMIVCTNGFRCAELP